VYDFCNKQMGRQFHPSKLSLRMGDLDPSHPWFLGPTRVNILNSITTASAAFAGLTVVSRDRQTDRHTTLLRL